MKRQSTKLLVFTDIHLVNTGDEIIGLDPAARFAEGLSHAVQHHPDAEGLLLVGDLTHQGRTAQFEQLKDMLADVPMPVTLMIGNHDNRGVFSTVFPDAPLTSTGHVQTMQALDGCVLITLDTTDPDVSPQHSGRLCKDRLAWLDRALTWADSRPVIVAMHHPPFATGFVGMDRIALQHPEPLRARLRAYPGPLHLLCGHIHRTISGLAHGLPFTILKSPCHQHPLSLGIEGSDHSTDEPGAYGIVLAGEDSILVHTEDFAIAAASTRTHDAGSG